MQQSALYQLPLLSLLQLPPHPSTYALALSRSRLETLTPQLFSHLHPLITTQGDKWMQVLRRLVANDYQQGAALLMDHQEYWELLLVQGYARRDAAGGALAEVRGRVLEAVASYGGRDNRGRALVAGSLAAVIRQELESNEMENLQHIFERVASGAGLLGELVSPVFEYAYVGNGDGQVAWRLHETTVRLLYNILRLFDKIQQEALKRMSIRALHEILQQNRCLQPLSKCISSIIDLLSTLPGNPSPPSTPILSLLLRQPRPALSDHYCTLLLCLQSACTTHCLHPLFASCCHHLAALASVLYQADLLRLNHYNNTSEQLIAINKEISSGAYSDTLAGAYMGAVTQMMANVGLFFREWLAVLWRGCRGSALEADQVLGYLVKVSLLSDRELVRCRQAEIAELVQAITEVVTARWQVYDQWANLQVLRFFMVFVGRGLGDSSQHLVKTCLQLCFNCLASQPGMSTEPCQLTPLQTHCLSLLQQLPLLPQTLPLLRRCLLPTLTTQLPRLPTHHYPCLQVLKLYIQHIPELVVRSGEQLLQFVYRLCRDEMQGARRRGPLHRVIEAVRIMGVVLGGEGEIGYEWVEERVVGGLLAGLLDCGGIDYDEELLGLLEVVMLKQEHFSPEIVRILSSLPSFYHKNLHKLPLLRHIYRAMATVPCIRQQIQYQYPDLILLMLQLFVDYLENVLSIEEYTCYAEQIRDTLWQVQALVQGCAARIMDDEGLLAYVGGALIKALDQCVGRVEAGGEGNRGEMASEMRELLLQVMMTVCHLCVSPLARGYTLAIYQKTIGLIKQTPLNCYSYLDTIKMVPVLLADRLLITPDQHENIVGELASFCRNVGQREMEGGMDREWKSIANREYWVEWPTRVRDYVDNVLRDLRNRKHIQMLEHQQYEEMVDQYLK